MTRLRRRVRGSTSKQLMVMGRPLSRSGRPTADTIMVIMILLILYFSATTSQTTIPESSLSQTSFISGKILLHSCSIIFYLFQILQTYNLHFLRPYTSKIPSYYIAWTADVVDRATAREIGQKTISPHKCCKCVPHVNYVPTGLDTLPTRKT